MDETLATPAPFALCRLLSAKNPRVVDRQGALKDNRNLLRQPPTPAEALTRLVTTAEPPTMA